MNSRSQLLAPLKGHIALVQDALVCRWTCCRTSKVHERLDRMLSLCSEGGGFWAPVSLFTWTDFTSSLITVPQSCGSRSMSLGQGLRTRRIPRSVRSVSRESSRALKSASGSSLTLITSTPRRVSREYSTAVESKNTVVFLYLNKETCWQVRRDTTPLGLSFDN